MTAPGRPGETPEQRDDRNLTDLLQELRVATLGVQVLFGFLLGLPFTARFSRLDAWQRWLYLAILVLSSISIALLVAPVAYHRLLFRRHQLGRLLRAANTLAIGGVIAVALAVTGVVLLVASYVEPGVPARRHQRGHGGPVRRPVVRAATGPAREVTAPGIAETVTAPAAARVARSGN